MSIWLTGDTHTPNDIQHITSQQWPEGDNLTKKDYLVILGDCGLIWSGTETDDEKYWKTWFNNRPYTTLYIDGNHENHYRLNRLKKKKMFGGTVGVVSDSVYHLKRGEVYTIDGKKIWCMGGAKSIDKHHRVEGIDWWREEQPNTTEMNHGLKKLEENDYKVDYLFTHTLPEMLKAQLEGIMIGGWFEDNTEKYLQQVYDETEFEKGYCGHFHVDREIEKYQILYQDVIELGVD